VGDTVAFLSRDKATLSSFKGETAALLFDLFFLFFFLPELTIFPLLTGGDVRDEEIARGFASARGDGRSW